MNSLEQPKKCIEMPLLILFHLPLFFSVKNSSLVPFSPKDEVYYEEIVSLKKHNPALNILLAVGGTNGNVEFTKMMSSLNTREAFAVQSAKYLKSMGMDGLDFDW